VQQSNVQLPLNRGWPISGLRVPQPSGSPFYPGMQPTIQPWLQTTGISGIAGTGKAGLQPYQVPPSVSGIAGTGTRGLQGLPTLPGAPPGISGVAGTGVVGLQLPRELQIALGRLGQVSGRAGVGEIVPHEVAVQREAALRARYSAENPLVTRNRVLTARYSAAPPDWLGPPLKINPPKQPTYQPPYYSNTPTRIYQGGWGGGGGGAGAGGLGLTMWRIGYG
jgi:hypothetical protein